MILLCWAKPPGAQFRRFVDDLLQLLAWYPSSELSPRFTDPQNLHLSFRTEILAIVGALVMNAAPDSKLHGRTIKSREGLTLWLRVLSLLSQREEELIETASELWPPALRHLASALDHHERSRSRSSPFRSRFFRPGLKYINSFEFQDLSAVRQLTGEWSQPHGRCHHPLEHRLPRTRHCRVARAWRRNRRRSSRPPLTHRMGARQLD